jgi:DNA polymerase-3 subunit alpha
MAGESKVKTITVDGESFEIVPLTEQEKNFRLNEISKKKNKIDFAKIPLDDKATWDLICSGLTKGVFQVEKQLGKRYCKEIKPRNINELSDVISLIRPGCLEAEFREKPDDPGKYSSITNTYIKVKNGTWKPEYIHECLEPILSETYSVPIYQEQIMRICTDFAGFTLKEADVARKAVGKKKADVMEKVKVKFLEGAKKNGHPEDLADTIFGWIEKFSGYGFNKSHGVSYALIAYKTAYAKAHRPNEYFESMLSNSDGKQDSLEEIQELVHEARLFKIDVRPPSLELMNVDFEMTPDGAIAFGLGHIKGVGAGAIKAVKQLWKPGESSIRFLTHAYKLCACCKKTTHRSNVIEALIKSGATDCFTTRKNRVKLLAEYKLLGILTARERVFVFNQVQSGKARDIKEAYTLLLDSKIPNKARRPRIIEQVREMNASLAGNPKRMCIAYEKYLLGIPLSGSLVELYYNERVNIKCRDFLDLSDNSKGNLGVVIEGVRAIKDKNGNRMCFLSVSDETYMLQSVVVFSSVYNKVAWIIEEGKPVFITGRKNKGSLLVNSIDHL